MGGKATVTSSTTPNPEAMKYYTDALAAGKAAASQPYQAWGTTASDYVAPINAQQNLGIAGVNASANSYQPYLAQATQATQGAMGGLSAEDINKYMSPYLSTVAGSTANLMNQANQQAQSGALGSAVSSGAFGGDRAGIAAANLNQQNQLAMGNTMANIFNQGYGQALSTAQQQQGMQMSGAAQLASLGAQAQQLGLAGANAQIGAGTLQQQNQQAGIDALINNFMQQKAFPYQNAQYMAGLASALGPLMGSSSKESHPTNLFGNVKLATGGRAERADGGGVAGGQQDQFAHGYVPDMPLTPAQLLASHIAGVQPGKSALGDIMSTASSMAKAGMASGGVAGYADGGFPEDEQDKKRHIILPSSGVSGFTGDQTTPISGVSAPPLGISDAMASPPPDKPAGLGVASLQHPVNYNAEHAAKWAAGSTNSASDMAADRRLSGIVPPPRPAGLVPPQTSADGASIASDAMAAIGHPTSAPASVLPASPAQPTTQTGNMVDTGKVATGVSAIVPLDKQIDFMLQEPEYKNYLSHSYRSPSEAATGMDQYYEISGGANRDEAASYANDVYHAAQSGDMSKLPPNVQTVYNMLIQRGIDPVKAAGTVGRLMVESYSRVDPNARNTLGGGNGTYGVAQWRGPRMEALAEFAGVPLESITGAPVSTPEGRYYSTGINGATGVRPPEQASQSNGDKSYDQRNWLGKMFYDPQTNKPNRDFILSLLGGLGAASGSSGNLLGILAAGAGGYSKTRQNLMQNEPVIAHQNIENVNTMMSNYQRARALGFNGTFDQFAQSAASGSIPYGSMSAPGSASTNTSQSYMGVPVDLLGRNMTAPITITSSDGKSYTIPAGMSYGYLQQMELGLNQYANLGIPEYVNALATVKDRMKAIEDNQGFVTTPDGHTVQDPSFAEVQNQNISRDTKNQLGAQVIQTLPSRKDNLATQSGSLDRLANAFSTVASSGTTLGPAAPAFKDLRAAAAQIGLPLDENTKDSVAAMDVIAKELAKNVMAEGGELSQNARDYLNSSEPNISMQKAAVAELLAVKRAMLEREKATLSSIDAAGTSPSAIYDADNAGRSQPVDWRKYLPEYQTMLGVGSEAQSGGLPKPKSAAERDALPKGTHYLDPNNQERIR